MAGKTRAVSRRRMMIVLGAGALGSGLGSAALAQQTTGTPKGRAPAGAEPPCDNSKPAMVVPGRFLGRDYTSTEQCCPDGMAVVLAGIKTLSGRSLTHMKPVEDAVKKIKDPLQYSMFAFGLTSAQLGLVKNALKESK